MLLEREAVFCVTRASFGVLTLYTTVAIFLEDLMTIWSRAVTGFYHSRRGC